MLLTNDRGFGNSQGVLHGQIYWEEETAEQQTGLLQMKIFQDRTIILRGSKIDSEMLASTTILILLHSPVIFAFTPFDLSTNRPWSLLG